MIGSGKETMTGLAAGLSATEDRELLTQLNVDSTFGFSPSFEVTSEGSFSPSNSAAMLESLHNFADDMLNFDDALDPAEYGIDETLFSKDDPLAVAIAQAAGVSWPTPWTEPDDWHFSSEKGWDGQTQGSPAMSGFEGGVFAESLQGLGVASTVAGKNIRKDQVRAVAVAAFKPGTTYNQAVTKKLLKKTLDLANLAEKRALVTKRARDSFQLSLAQVERNDKEVNRLYNLVFDAAGKVKSTATDKDLKRLLDLRRKNVALGRDTVRLQKLNLLASAITHNTLTQLVATQNLAKAVSSGAPEAVPALTLAFDKLGRENAKIRDMRATQRENWSNQGQSLEGFDGLYGLDVIERPFDEMENDLAALDFSFKRFRQKAKKKFKNVGRVAGKVVKESAKATKVLVKAAVVAPTKGTINAAKRIARGDVKGAFKAVGGSVIQQAKGLKDFAATTVLKWGCEVANTKAFKAGVQAVGQAVGTAVGGIYGQPTVGGAVGTEAGGQVANLQRNTCGAMKTVGLTDGKFKPGKIKQAATGFVQRALKETFSPKAQLKSLKNIAQNAVGGQFSSAFKVGGVDVMQKIGLDPNKLVTNNPALQNLYKQGTNKLQEKMQRGFQRSAGGLLKKAGVPYAGQIVNIAQSGQMPNYQKLMRNVNIKQITEQGANLARNQAAAIARRQASKAVTRVVPRMTASASAGGMIRGNASGAELLRIANQLAPADVERVAGPMATRSVYMSQPTEDALPYVGSIGRDY